MMWDVKVTKIVEQESLLTLYHGIGSTQWQTVLGRIEY